MVQNILAQLTISLYSNKSTCLTWGELSSLHRETKSQSNKQTPGWAVMWHNSTPCGDNLFLSGRLKRWDQPVSQLCFSLLYSPFVYSTLVSRLFSFPLASYHVFSSCLASFLQTMSCTSSLSLSSQPSSFLSLSLLLSLYCYTRAQTDHLVFINFCHVTTQIFSIHRAVQSITLPPIFNNNVYWHVYSRQVFMLVIRAFVRLTSSHGHQFSFGYVSIRLHGIQNVRFLEKCCTRGILNRSTFIIMR